MYTQVYLDVGGGSLKTSGPNENLEGVSVSLWILVLVWHQAGPSMMVYLNINFPI